MSDSIEEKEVPVLNSVQDFLLKTVFSIRTLEDAMLEGQPFKLPSASPSGPLPLKAVPFKSAYLMLAYRELQIARMMCGDLLRLFGIEKPYQASYTGSGVDEKPAYFELGVIQSPEDFWKSFEDIASAHNSGANEVNSLAHYRTSLGKAKEGQNGGTGIFYDVAAFGGTLMAELKQNLADNPNAATVSAEFKVYYSKLLEAIKLANCYLGLRYGELVAR